MRSRVPLPAGLSGPGFVLVGVSVALYVVARTTGAGWDIVILCALLAVVALAVVWPAVALVGVGVGASTPPDATVGRPLPVTVTVTGHAFGLRVRVLTGPSRWYRVDAPGEGQISVVPQRRGVFDALVVELRSASPLGLAAWRRRVRVALQRPLEVAPQPVTMRYDATQGADREAQISPRSSTHGHDDTRGVRGYVDGDPIRLVHWPATARTGAVMVRELEGPKRSRLLVVVDLRAPRAGADDEVEAAASRAAGLAIAALEHGTLVDLATVETDGPRTAPVRSALEVGRRLARAVAGAPVPGTVPAGTEVRPVRADRGTGR